MRQSTAIPYTSTLNDSFHGLRPAGNGPLPPVDPSEAQRHISGSSSRLVRVPMTSRSTKANAN